MTSFDGIVMRTNIQAMTSTTVITAKRIPPRSLGPLSNPLLSIVIFIVIVVIIIVVVVSCRDNGGGSSSLRLPIDVTVEVVVEVEDYHPIMERVQSGEFRA